MIEIVKSVLVFAQEMVVRHYKCVFLSYIIKNTIKNCHIEVWKQLIVHAFPLRSSSNMNESSSCNSEVFVWRLRSVSHQMFMAFTHMVLRAKKQSQSRAEREREREKDTVNINAQRDRDRRKRGKKCCWEPTQREKIPCDTRRRRLDSWRDWTIYCTAEGYECSPGQEKHPFKDSPGGLNHQRALLEFPARTETMVVSLRRRWTRPSCQNQV